MKTKEDIDVDGSAPGFFSLLYPPGITSDHSALFNQLDPAAQHDLGVDQIATSFTADREQQKEILNLLSQLLCNPDMITYRQEVIEDLIRNPELVEHLDSLSSVIDSLVKYSFHKEKGLNSLHEVTWRIGELGNIVDCIGGLGKIFDGVEGSINSLGLRSLREEIRTIQNDPTYQNLSESCRSCSPNCDPVQALRSASIWMPACAQSRQPYFRSMRNALPTSPY